MPLDQIEAEVEKLTPEQIQLAKAALQQFPECFWTRNPNTPLWDRSDVELVIRRLRQNGSPQAWRTARQIEACL